MYILFPKICLLSTLSIQEFFFFHCQEKMHDNGVLLLNTKSVQVSKRYEESFIRGHDYQQIPRFRKLRTCHKVTLLVSGKVRMWTYIIVPRSSVLNLYVVFFKILIDHLPLHSTLTLEMPDYTPFSSNKLLFFLV